MSRPRFTTLGLLLLLSACADAATEPFAPPPHGNPAISDALHGQDRNPFFFWLPPIVDQPASALLGEAELRASPRVIVVCQASNELAECDDTVPVQSGLAADVVADFTPGAGLVVGPDMFQVDFDTHAFGLRASDPDGTSYTTYRIVVYTDPLTELGGPFVLGYADFQVGETGKVAKNLTTGDVIGLVDGRTLPIKFRIDRGAYAHALKANLATGAGDPADEPLCQENCTVAFVAPGDTTTTALKDLTGLEVTAVRFLPGDVTTPSVLVIDERTTEGEDASCADGVSLQKKYCYRYRIFPDEPFNNPVRFGICPRDVPLDAGSLWRILKVDYDELGRPIVTRPPEVDVRDFLPCTPPAGASLMSRLFRYALDNVAPPLYAQTSTRTWGGTARDFSDLFWALDAQMTPVTTTDTAIDAGTTFPAIVQVVALYPEPDVPLDSARVTFRITAGAGWLEVPGGTDVLDADSADGHAVAFTLLTDADGRAGVVLTAGSGENTVEVTSEDALTPDLTPIVFEVEGVDAGVTLSGTIRYSHDPAAGVPLSLIRYGTAYAHATTDGNGQYVLGPVEPGQYQVCFNGEPEYAGYCTSLMDVSDDLTYDAQIVKWVYTLTPTHQATASSPQPEFVWTSLPEAANYQFWIFHRLPGGALEQAVHANTGTDTTFTPSTPLTAGETYLWEVGAYDDAGTGIGTPRDGWVEFYIGEGSWTPAGEAPFPLRDFAAVVLTTGSDAGKVLVVGGWANVGAELYDPATGTFTGKATVYQHGAGLTATVLQDGRVLIAGGTGPAADFAGAELYDPMSGTFEATGSLSYQRHYHAATLLDDGRVLVVGGRGGVDPDNPADLAGGEVYDPASGLFTPLADSMGDARIWPSTALLPDGNVLIAGGQNATSLSSAELFDPDAGAFQPTGSMTRPLSSCGVRGAHLEDGRVLFAGAAFEIYDYATGTFSAAAEPDIGTMLCASVVPLPDGRVLVAGGVLSHQGGVPGSAARIYDPALDAFTPASSMIAARSQHVGVLLPGGRVVVIGGAGRDWTDLASAEIFNLP